MTYTTKCMPARQGIITKEMELVAEKEGISPEELRQYMAEGKASFRQQTAQMSKSTAWALC